MCQCRVPCSEKGWEEHVRGIRHRRNLVNMRHFEGRGQHVVSIFEAREQYKNERGTSRNTRSVAVAGKEERLNHLYRQLRRWLTLFSGQGPAYQTALQRFSLDRLAAVEDDVRRIFHSADEVLRPSETLTPAHMAIIADNLHAFSAPTLSINIPYSTSGPEACAMSAAVHLLMGSLSKAANIVKLSLTITLPDHARLFQQGAVGTREIVTHWDHILKALGDSLGVPLSLQEVSLITPPGILSSDAPVKLVETMHRTRQQHRQLLLMALHPRVGAQSPLADLPLGVFQHILDMVMPRKPCRLTLGLPPCLPGQGPGVDHEGPAGAFPQLPPDLEYLQAMMAG